MSIGQQSNILIEVQASPTDEDVRAVQNGELWAFNVAQTGDDKLERLVIRVYAEGGEAIGGLVGTYVWGWLHIETCNPHGSISPPGYRLAIARCC